MKLLPTETELIGRGEMMDGRVLRDATSHRIDWLTGEYLEKIASTNWETLFRDPEGGRYWERTYPRSEMHGGGPAKLTCISSQLAETIFGPI